MKATKNYEAPVAEMIEMNMPVVLTNSGVGDPVSGGITPPPTPPGS